MGAWIDLLLLLLLLLLVSTSRGIMGVGETTIMTTVNRPKMQYVWVKVLDPETKLAMSICQPKH